MGRSYGSSNAPLRDDRSRSYQPSDGGLHQMLPAQPRRQQECHSPSRDCLSSSENPQPNASHLQVQIRDDDSVVASPALTARSSVSHVLDLERPTTHELE